ncbi:hypothetical protein, partial [Klebsiella quasipneumoniae]|uniref:hypothetical protein n=1 Tax=Klebsiella quasipneumoniae TaxID=1463165 RepID=UPI00350F3A46
ERCGVFCCVVYASPVALRLPGLRIRHGATPLLWRGQDMQHRLREKYRLKSCYCFANQPT